MTGVPALHDYDTAVAFRDDVDREIDLIGGAGPEHEECAGAWFRMFADSRVLRMSVYSH